MSIVTVGLEIHIALKTDRKSFAPEDYNSSSWVSLGFIGTLPTHNKEALEKAIKVANLLNTKVNYENIVFDRKNYFYYDLPRGYQITQFFNPLGREGCVELSNKKIRIKQVHLEEDTAQQYKDNDQIRFNFLRLGRALVEIVTEPDLSCFEEVEEFLKLIRRMCSFNDLSNVAYEEGEIRVDLNISVREKEEDPLNAKSEVKNLNSLQAIKKSIDFIVKEQEEKIKRGEENSSFTYAWSEKDQNCYVMRKKGDSSDYFYVPESNLPPISLTTEEYKELTKDLIRDFTLLSSSWKEQGLKESEIEFLLENYKAFNLVSKLNKELNNIVSSYNWIINIVSGMLENCDFVSLPYEEIEKVVLETEKSKKISLKIAKSILKEILVNGLTFKEANKKLNVSLISDPEAIRKLVLEALEQYKDQIPKLMSNPVKLEKLIIGECMKKSRGQADPILVKTIFDELIKTGG